MEIQHATEKKQRTATSQICKPLEQNFMFIYQIISRNKTQNTKEC